ncbi:hypothetical protein PV08_04575 [Exophiala spinifera]|uniref:Uncharacterized protein n=1 Tax=Exophiala spinifera TaxID=91928 RepID=A0A0D1YQ69_9EURO|nr:uncharacterized protein PV08_04575 [Exophiala spinifera]KIW17381.1 hypothetical protein PV08_04575 [Exophiala spinifera]
MAVHHVLDDYYLAITLLITVAYQLVGFCIAYTCQFDKLTDFAGGTNFVILSVLTLSLSATHTARQILSSLCLAVWALRLSGFLFFRILKTGSDTRFDDRRSRFLPFLAFWTLQALWVWTVSLPVTILNSPRVTASAQPPFGTPADVAGVVMFAAGFLLEAAADVQKYRFRRDAGNERAATCDTGLFAWSRHPNYFGEIVVQFAVFTMAVSPSAYGYVPSGSGPYAAQHASVAGAVLLTLLLLFVSGLTLQERPGAKKMFERDGPGGECWTRHKAWLDRTSILVPLPPGVWVRLPRMVKRTVGIEWPIYVFDPEKHVGHADVQQRREDEARGREESHDGLVSNNRRQYPRA